MEQAFRRGLAAFRWGAWIWIAATLVVYWHTDYLRHRWIAAALVSAALIFTAVQTALVPTALRFQNFRRVAMGELAVGVTVMALDGLVRRPGIVFENGPTLGSWWPIVGLMSAATYLPLWVAGLSGVTFGAARFVSVLLNGFSAKALTGGEILSIVDTGVFSALAAMSVGGLMKLLRNAEMEVSLARARDEVARTLHDGVLQTLAVVERRSGDEALARLAREQERELRRYLFEAQAESAEQEQLGSGLMKAAARFEDVYRGRVDVVIAQDLPDIRSEVVKALVGAVGEALTNAGKHGSATAVTVYLEPTEGKYQVFCSVKDNGCGFAPAAIQERVGLASSIRGRLHEVGGRIELKSAPGEGAEVLMWAP